MHIPKAGAIAALVGLKHRAHLAERAHGLAAYAKTIGYTCQIAAAMNDNAGINIASAEFVDFRAIAAIIDDRHQEFGAMTARSFQFLDMHQQAAIAFNQQHLAILTRSCHANRRRQAIADGAEITDHMITFRRAALQIGHGKAKVMATADHHIPILRHHRIQFHDRLARINRARRDGEFLAVRHISCNQRGQLFTAEALAACTMALDGSGDGFRRRLGIGADMQIRRAQPLP